MEQETTAFRELLQEEFLKRTNRNPRFSIRAFASQLEIEPSSLAQIMRGKRRITPKMCDRLGTKLGMSPLKIRNAKKGIRPKSSCFKDFKKLEEDAFKVIADWYYYAILEITQCDNFNGTPQWISRALNLPMAQTLDAIERLKRLNYLEITPEGKWIDRLGDSNNLGNDFMAPAFTEHQRQILVKAQEALDKTEYKRRVQSSMTVVVSQERVKEAKCMILNFIEDLNEFLRAGETKEEVYNISVSLYPLSNISSRTLYE